MHKEILTFVVIDFADTVALNLYMSQIFILKTELLIHNVLQLFTLQIPFQVI